MYIYPADILSEKSLKTIRVFGEQPGAKHSLAAAKPFKTIRIFEERPLKKPHVDTARSEEPYVEEAKTLVQGDEDLKRLVVYNDDHNTFEHVIETLMAVCLHSKIQAEQCTYIIHHTGKCAVKEGQYATLKPMQEGMTEAGIAAEVV